MVIETIKINGEIVEIPVQQFIDRFTRMDELLVLLLRKMGGGPMAGLSLDDQRRIAESGQWVPYSIKTYPMDAARDNELVIVEGDFIHGWTDGVYDGIGVRFNNTNNDLVYFQRRNPVYGFKFWRLYLTHTAQAGKTLDLLIGREASAYSESAQITSVLTQLAPLEKAIQHGVAETANTNILATSLSPTNTPCLFRTMVVLETSGVFSAILIKATASKTLKFNAGGALVANAAYMFDVLVHSGDTVNFQTDTSGNVTLRVQEIIGGVQ